MRHEESKGGRADVKETLEVGLAFLEGLSWAMQAQKVLYHVGRDERQHGLVLGEHGLELIQNGLVEGEGE